MEDEEKTVVRTAIIEWYEPLKANTECRGTCHVEVGEVWVAVSYFYNAGARSYTTAEYFKADEIRHITCRIEEE